MTGQRDGGGELETRWFFKKKIVTHNSRECTFWRVIRENLIFNVAHNPPRITSRTQPVTSKRSGSWALLDRRARLSALPKMQIMKGAHAKVHCRLIGMFVMNQFYPYFPDG
jgi:hypothetical protein